MWTHKGLGFIATMVGVVLTLISVDLQAHGSPNPPSVLARFVGRWSVTVEGREPSISNAQVEAWRSMPDGSLAGWSGVSHGTGIQKSEDLALVDRSGTWTYEATVVGQNDGKTVPFACTKVTSDIIVFENPLHDFPQKIEYHFTSDTEIIVMVSGSSRSFALRFQRINAGVVSYLPLQFDKLASYNGEVPATTAPDNRILELSGDWEGAGRKLHMRTVGGSDRYTGTIVLLKSDRQAPIEFNVIVSRKKSDWTLTLQRNGWNNGQETVYTVVHSSKNSLIFQNHFGESPNQLHFEFPDNGSLLLSCDDVVGVEGESSGNVIEFIRPK